MNARTQRILAVLLVAQLALAIGLAVAGWRRQDVAAPGPLLGFQIAQVDRVTISGADKASAVIARKDGTWRLAALDELPADATRLTTLLQHLEALKTGTPVATSAEAATRFKVADDAFERRITLESGGKALATLYVGTTQSMRLSYVRRAGDHDVLLGEIENFEAPTADQDWLDKGLLQVPAAEIVSIEVDGLKLARIPVKEAAPPAPEAGKPAAPAPKTPPPTTWSAGDLPRGQALDAAGVDRLVARIAQLRVQGVVPASSDRDKKAKEPAKATLVLSFARDKGEAQTLEFAPIAGSEDLAVTSSAYPHDALRLPAALGKQLIEAARRDKLVHAARG